MTVSAHLCLVLWTKVRIWQAGGHVEHEAVVELTHLVGDVNVLAASFHDNLLAQSKHGEARRGVEMPGAC